MSYSVKTVPDFDKALKNISKKHKLIKYDISDLIDELEINPTLGVHLGHNIYKIRLALSGSNKGKSGGARIISYVFIDHHTVYLVAIYLKSEYDTVNTAKIIQMLTETGII